MINRLKLFMEEPEERPPATDYFEIQCDTGVYYFSRGEAQRVGVSAAAALATALDPRHRLLRRGAALAPAHDHRDL